MSERRAYRITGTVQGVGFRWWTRKVARTNDLRGTVRNASDGSVEIEAEGDPAALDAFERELSAGPPTASVEAVRNEEPGEDPLPAGFAIIR